MIETFDLEKYLTQLKLSAKLQIEVISQEINIGHGATYNMLFSIKPNYYAIERMFSIYSELPRHTEVTYYIDDINFGNVLPFFKLLDIKRDLPFLGKWIKNVFIKIIIKNIHRYDDTSIIIQSFPEYIDTQIMEKLGRDILNKYNYTLDLPSRSNNFSVAAFTPNYRCKTCLSGANITYDAMDNISLLSFQDRMSYQPNNITYFWGNNGHDCPLLHYVNRSQILLAIANGEIEAI